MTPPHRFTNTLDNRHLPLLMKSDCYYLVQASLLLFKIQGPLPPGPPTLLWCRHCWWLPHDLTAVLRVLLWLRAYCTMSQVQPPCPSFLVTAGHPSHPDPWSLSHSRTSLWNQPACIQIPALLLIICVTWASHFEPQFAHLQNGDNNSFNIKGLLLRVKQVTTNKGLIRVSDQQEAPNRYDALLSLSSAHRSFCTHFFFWLQSKVYK